MKIDPVNDDNKREREKKKAKKNGFNNIAGVNNPIFVRVKVVCVKTGTHSYTQQNK